MARRPTCSVVECDRRVAAAGLCNTHYLRKRKTGTAGDGPIRHRLPNGASVAEVLEKYTLRGEGCWEWQGKLYPNGYGVAHVPGSPGSRYAHRVAWEHANGVTLSASDLVRHTCDNRRCVNPDHLEIGTHQDNMNDMVARGRSPRGARNAAHKLSEDDVRAIRKSYLDGEMQKSIAERFGVSRSAVCCIVNGSAWRHVA